MFKYLVILLASLAATSCSPKITKKTVNYNYSNVVFSPAQVQKQTSNGLTIVISPIDTKSLNYETFEAALSDGNYEREFAFALEKEESNSDMLSRVERDMKRGKVNCLSAITDLVKKGEMPENIGLYLKKRILYGSDAGRDGSEVASLSESENFDDEFNPFKVNEKYLSVFKVTSENKSSEIVKIKIGDFQVVGGEEQLYPLKMIFFEENLKPFPEKIKNAYRMNMPEDLVITPNQKITKYLAIPAINPSSKELKVQYIKDNKFTDFDFEVSSQSLSKSYELEYYKLMSIYGEDSAIKYFYAVSYDGGVSFAVADDKLYVSNEKKSKPTDVYGIAFSLSSGKVFFGKKLKFKFSEIVKNSISFKFSELNKK